MTLPLLEREAHKGLIEPNKLAFTTAAGVASGFVAILALLVALLDWLGAVDVSENIKIALIGLAGAGLLGLAIASAGYAVTRAYPAGRTMGVVALSSPMDVEVNGKPGIAFAAWVKRDGKVEYLVGRLGEGLEWEPGTAVSLRD